MSTSAGARPGHSVPVADPLRSERAAVAYLAFLGAVMAVGVDIALPAFDSIRDTFGMSPESSVSLVGTTYFLGMALGQLLIGPAADRFGRSSLLKITLGVSLVGAAVSAAAPSFGVLLGARFVWGLGSAGPAVLRTAIARDLFVGDRMARVVSRIMAVFLLGPIFVPSIGQAILSASSWRGVFAFAILASCAAFLWTVRFGETLAPENRRTFDVRTFLDGARQVAATRPTVLYVAAQTFATAAFLIFLGSSQPIMEGIYGRGERFALYFGVAGIGMALSLLGSQRAIGAVGSRRVLVVAVAAAVVVSGVGLALALISAGVPSFWAWFGWVACTNACLIIVSPLCNALALEPMGELAGTASALLGFVTLAGGAVAASVVDSLVVDTITPMTGGYLIFSAAALACVVAALRSERVRA